MERYALLRHLQRQRQLVRRMAPGQPLGAYVAQHRRLAAEIGPMPEFPASAPWRAVPSEEARFARPVDAELPSLERPVLQAEENEPVTFVGRDMVPEVAQEITKHNRPISTMVEAQRASSPAPARPSMQAEKRVNIPAFRTTPAEEEVTREQVQGLAQQSAEAEQVALPALTTMEQDARVLDMPLPEAQRSVQQGNRHPAGQQEQSGIRRARIEEHPLPAPGVSPMQGKRTGAEMIQSSEASRHATKAKQKTEAQKEAEHEVAELFTSSSPGRSPQEWFALLTQGERKQQPAPIEPTARDQGHELRSVQADYAVQPRSQGREARLARPHEATQAVGHEAHLGQSSPLQTMSDQTTSWPGRASTTRFVSAQRQASDEQHRESAGGAASASEDTTPAESVSLRARQLLKPLVGFDPADARVHRGPTAARLASAQQADAVTMDDDIFLAAGYANDEPKTLGLLAHELTHVARHHEPRFVPPVVNGRGDLERSVQSAPAELSQGTAPRSGESLANADEEELAEQVEQQVMRQATGTTKALATLSPSPATQTFMPSNAHENGLQLPETQGSWSGLPAPWEPLPNWLAASSPAPTGGNDLFASLPQARQSLPSSSASSGSGQRSAPTSVTGASAGGAAPAAQRAGRERSHDFAGAQADWQGPSLEQQREPEPDLDKLARQVYAVLKRRLDVERRRMS